MHIRHLKQKILAIATLGIAAAIPYCAEKPISPDMAEQIFGHIEKIGHSHGKDCAGSYLNRDIVAKALDRANRNQSALTEYLKTKPGKEHMRKAIRKCIRTEKTSKKKKDSQ